MRANPRSAASIIDRITTGLLNVILASIHDYFNLLCALCLGHIQGIFRLNLSNNQIEHLFVSHTNPFYRFRTNVTVVSLRISLTIHSITMYSPKNPVRMHSIDIKSNAILSTASQVPIMPPFPAVRSGQTTAFQSFRSVCAGTGMHNFTLHQTVYRLSDSPRLSGWRWRHRN